MDRREHTKQLLEACIGLLQDSTDETAVHVTSTGQETPSDQTIFPPKSHDKSEDEADPFEVQDKPPFSAEISETPKSVNVNITINNFVVATNSPVNIGPSCGNRYSCAGKDTELLVQFNKDLEDLEDAAMKYIQFRQIQSKILHKMVDWLKICDRYHALLEAVWRIFLICLIFQPFLFEGCVVQKLVAVFMAILMAQGMLNLRSLKLTERCLSENLKAAVEQMNSTWVSLGKPGKITSQVVFGSEQIFESEGSINTLAWKVWKDAEKLGSLIKDFQSTAKKLNCPSKEDVKVCISRVRTKMVV